MVAYILQMAQEEHGGLRDHPPDDRDPFHTCFALAGLCLCCARDRRIGDLQLPEIDPLVPCPKVLTDRLRAYFLERPFTPQ
jgi:prenyltransferase beta subunit